MRHELYNIINILVGVTVFGTIILTLSNL